MITSFISGLLALHYWLTRTSTVGISIQGGALSALASLLQIMSSVDLKKKQSLSKWLFVLLIGKLPFALKDIFILKAISRAELDWYKKWIPVARISPATHLERASARVEARIPWLYKAMVSHFKSDYIYIGIKSKLGVCSAIDCIFLQSNTIFLLSSSF